jgi:hypothetical protein
LRSKDYKAHRAVSATPSLNFFSFFSRVLSFNMLVAVRVGVMVLGVSPVIIFVGSAIDDSGTGKLAGGWVVVVVVRGLATNAH